MILEFTRLVISNFGSFIGEHELNLSSFGPGLHFIKGRNEEEPRLGSNGVGKSTILNALCWCLYGRTPDGRRNPDIQPRFGDKDTTITNGFLIDDKPQQITRTTHPNSLLLNDKEVGQEQIDQAIGLSFDTFINTILLGQGRPLFFDLPPKAKMDLFVAVLNLDRWDARADYASEQSRTLQTREATLTGELTGLEAQQTQLESLLEKARANWAEWRDEQERLNKTAKETLIKLKAKRETVETEKADYDLAYDGTVTELKNLQTGIRTLTVDIERLTQERSPISTQVALHKEKARSLRAELDTLGEAEECPTCGQSLKGTNLHNHKTELYTQLKALEKKLASTEAVHARISKEITDFQRTLNNGRSAERDFQARVNANRDALVRIEPVIAGLNAQIAQLEANSKQQQVAENPYTGQVADLKRKITKLKTEITELGDRLRRLSEQIERTKFWVKGFKEVRLYVIEDVLQELELTTNVALADIGLIDWQVQYSIEKETKAGTVQRGLNVMIQSPKDKGPVTWACWSGGEGQRLRLIGALALSEVLLARAGVEAKMEILDEPTRGLSDEGVWDLCEFLADRSKQLSRQVWYIDHMSVESSRFTSVLTVVKTAKGSELVI